MYWINGQVADSIPLNDRSFQYGDGCFSTILTCNGKPDLWDYHLERMQSTLTRLSIESPDWKQVSDWISQIAFPDTKAGIKIHISRGQGGRGYSPKGICQSQVTISRFRYPAHYGLWCDCGVKLAICKTRLGLNPLLAGMKHNNRLEQVLIKNELDKQDADDGIVLDIHQRVIETSMANVFWVSDGKLCTPKLTMAGVEGVMRRHVIQTVGQASLSVNEGEFLLSDLLNAEEIFICNSLLGIAPVIQLESQNQYSIGSITRYLQERIIK
ncbi:aminodeoxychorismate lyase [Vibrio salinus]|uniref:aminodeoxychorismate lyase n=1 Tax=Vibrio salinus TaxID=2899784 RepID=UPI001E5D728F|nr:aminodeoxychorismate lyase [Vibrio salinus]MCE0494625.1 aminodeoxychorismate lyase [Vibrio salinus]